VTVAAPPPGYLPPSGAEIVFGLLGIAVLASAVLVVTSRQLVHAALWLVVTLGGLAGCYLVLSAEFVAWVQVLIYLGAVVVLLLFGVMLTRAPIGRTPDLDAPVGQRLAALAVAVAMAAVLLTVVVEAWRAAYLTLPGRVGTAESTGGALFRRWVLPFEALSVLLLAALVGAIVISRADVGRQPTRLRGSFGLRADAPEPRTPAGQRDR
jgi:NADH-quinone oxidoreductase subunit J